MPAPASGCAAALFTASGLPAMYRVVADAMGTSQAALTQMQTARWFGDMASASAKAANFELESSRTEAPQAGAPGTGERVALERETGVLNEVAANVERSAKHIEAQFSAIIGEEMSGFAPVAAGRSSMPMPPRSGTSSSPPWRRAARRAPGPSKVSRCGARWRREFKDCFDRAAARVLELQGKVAPELAQLMSLIAPEIAMPAEPEKRLLLIAPPSMAALSRFVALDIEEFLVVVAVERAHQRRASTASRSKASSRPSSSRSPTASPKPPSGC